MNLRLTDQRIRATCCELLRTRDTVSGRQLCAVLRERFGAVGKTERVFRIWREEVVAAAAPAATVALELDELQRRLAAAELAAAENLARAERAEYREQAHQDKWAVEVDRMRQAARNQPDREAAIRALQEQVLRLSRELERLRDGIEEQAGAVTAPDLGA
jgi:hypothetical protein